MKCVFLHKIIKECYTMKKMFALLLVLTMVLALAACSNEPAVEPAMTHAEYMAAAMDSEVVVEFYVQDHQDWWENKVTVYGQDADGGYFAYELACTEEDAAKLVPGTKIRVTGYKGEWAGEIEIMDGTFTFVNAEPWIAEATDVTALLGTEDLVKHQNEKVLFKGLTVEKIEYKNGEPGNDIYVTVSYNGASYDFCVESYLTGPNTDTYAAVGALEAGDVEPASAATGGAGRAAAEKICS